MTAWKCCQSHPPQLHLVEGLGQLPSVLDFPVRKTPVLYRPHEDRQGTQGDTCGDRRSQSFPVSPPKPPWQHTAGLSATCSKGVIRNSVKRKSPEAATLKQETTARWVHFPVCICSACPGVCCEMSASGCSVRAVAGPALPTLYGRDCRPCRLWER